MYLVRLRRGVGKVPGEGKFERARSVLKKEESIFRYIYIYESIRK